MSVPNASWLSPIYSLRLEERAFKRAAKFVKYLPLQGWKTSVLTVSNPSVPVFDESLNSDIPEDAVIRYAKTLEPGYGLKSLVSAGRDGKPGPISKIVKSSIRSLCNMILQPDSQILWWPSAVAQGMRLLNEIDHHAIFVSAPPFSSFMVGATLSRKTGLPLVLDYRDEWDISNTYWENKQKGPLSRWIQSKMQRNIVERADGLIATTQSSAASLQRIANQVGSRAKVTHIYNGYDAADFQTAVHVPDLTSQTRHRGDVSESGEATCTAAAASLRGYDEPSNGRFRLAYVGTLWTLTSVGPLVQSLEQLAAQHPELARRLEVVFAGRRTGAQNKLIDRILELSCHVQQQPYLEHGRAIDLMRRSDGLCLLLSDVPHANRIVPAKVFEYMAARKPILAIAPDGEVSDILADCPHARICRPSDTNRIVQVLSEFIDQCEDGMCEDGMCEEDGLLEGIALRTSQPCGRACHNARFRFFTTQLRTCCLLVHNRVRRTSRMHSFVSLMYHNVVRKNDRFPRLSPSVTSYFVKEAAFADHVALLCEQGRCVDWEEVCRFYVADTKSRCQPPQSLPAVQITFDDGWLGSVDVAGPILES